MQIANAESVYTTAILSGPVCAMLGLDWRDVLHHASLRFKDDGRAGSFVSGDDYVLIWNAIDALADTALLAQYLGTRMAQGPAVPVLFAISAAPNFETGLSRMSRYKHLFGPMRFAIDADRGTYTIRVIADGIISELPTSFAAAQIIFLHAKAKALTSRMFKPKSVSLPLPEKELEALVPLFEVEPAFGRPALMYHTADMRIPFISQNDALWFATEQDLQTQSLIVSGDSPITHRVRACLLEAFSTTEPTTAHVCDRLNTSKSTLQRRLRGEGTSFQKLLDTTRRELAMRYLRSSALSNQQIAHLLGYRDTSAFQRAFRKWTGETPRQLRHSGRHPSHKGSAPT